MQCMCATSCCSAPRIASWSPRRAPTLALYLTFDLDFGEILALGILKEPSVVIFRLTDERADSVNRRLDVVLSEQSELNDREAA
jgi:hypothetical protein